MGTGGPEIKRTSGVEIGQNTEKSPGDAKRFTVTHTPVGNHQLTQMRRTLKLVNNNNNNNQRTRKLMTMHNALHPRHDIDDLCQEQKEEEDTSALKIASIHR